MKNKIKIYSSFRNIKYKNKKFDFDDPVQMYTTTYTHIYFSGGFTEKLTQKQRKQRHGCIRSGHWCWKNLWDRPQDIKYIFYFIRKVVTK